MQIRNGIELERCGQVRATKPGSGSGPVEWERYYMLSEIYLGLMGKIKLNLTKCKNYITTWHYFVICRMVSRFYNNLNSLQISSA
jgi:hypothetical protein